MLVLSLLSNLLKVNHCNLLLPIEKMVPALMLLFSFPIVASVTSFMNVRSDRRVGGGASPN